MKPAPFDYVMPLDASAAIRACVETPDAKFIAGGQSLGPMLNLRIARPSVLVDISRIPELRQTEERGSNWIVGAAVTHSEIEDGRTSLGREGMLPTVARQIAYRAIRNRGTIGGSIVHADAAADWPLALSACGASVVLRGAANSRKLRMEDFLRSSFTTAIGEGEMLTAIEIPKPSKSVRWGYYKLCRKAGEFPIASAAIVIDGDHCRAFLGALSDKPRPMIGLANEISQTKSMPSVGALVAAVSEAAPELDAVDRRIFVTCAARAANEALAT